MDIPVPFVPWESPHARSLGRRRCSRHAAASSDASNDARRRDFRTWAKRRWGFRRTVAPPAFGGRFFRSQRKGQNWKKEIFSALGNKKESKGWLTKLNLFILDVEVKSLLYLESIGRNKYHFFLKATGWLKIGGRPLKLMVQFFWNKNDDGSFPGGRKFLSFASKNDSFFASRWGFLRTVAARPSAWIFFQLANSCLASWNPNFPSEIWGYDLLQVVFE